MMSALKPIDTTWFRQQLAARKLSQRALARLMKIDAAAVSLMLRGHRRMTNQEAHKLASVLGTKVTEVLRHSGVDVIDDVRKVPISAWVNNEGAVSLFPDKTHAVVAGPADCPTGTYCVQCRAPSEPQDSWLLFVNPAQEQPENCLEYLCVVAIDHGALTTANVRRGYRPGRWNLLMWPNREFRPDVTVAWCSKVTWIKPRT